MFYVLCNSTEALRSRISTSGFPSNFRARNIGFLVLFHFSVRILIWFLGFTMIQTTIVYAPVLQGC